jgi:type IV pilus assembly protein PilP
MKLIALILPLLTTAAFAQTPPAGGPAAGNQAPAMADDMSGDASMSDPSTMFQGIMDPFEYDQRGRRDPFVQPVPDKPVEQGNVHGPLLALQKFELSQLALVGIIWDVKRPKAMIKDPTGTTHVVGTNTKVGPHNGYIAVIREGEMVVVETQEQDGKLVSSAQVVKIAR